MLVLYKDMARSTSNQIYSAWFFSGLRYLAVSESGEVSAAVGSPPVTMVPEIEAEKKTEVKVLIIIK